MVKAIFFDIDGTLVALGATKMSQVMIDTLNQLRKQGILLFIATGRQAYLLDVVTKDFQFDGYITLNGSLCYDKNFNCFYENPINQDDQKIMKQLFNNNCYSLVIVEQNDSYINYLNDLAKQTYDLLHIKVPRFDLNHGNDIFQLIAYADEKTEQELMTLLPNSKAARWNALGIDILPKSGGKLVGIAETLKHFNIDLKDTMAFGDGQNDIDMLEYVACGVAMENAHPNVKAIANDLCGHVNDDGITTYLKRLRLIN